jgi:hypothetical protein
MPPLRGLIFFTFFLMIRSLFRESGLMSGVWGMGMPSVSVVDLGLVLLFGLDIFFWPLWSYGGILY